MPARAAECPQYAKAVAVRQPVISHEQINILATQIVQEGHCRGKGADACEGETCNGETGAQSRHRDEP